MLEKLKKVFKKESKPELIASSPCICKETCNRGLVIYKFSDNDDLLEVSIDWRISKEPPKAEDKSVSVLVSRNFLLENIIKSGKPILNSATFQIELDKYFAEFNQEKTPDIKLPTEVKIQEFMDWLKIKVEREYKEFE